MPWPITCGACGQTVDLRDFKAHLETHDEEFELTLSATGVGKYGKWEIPLEELTPITIGPGGDIVFMERE